MDAAGFTFQNPIGKSGLKKKKKTEPQFGNKEMIDMAWVIRTDEEYGEKFYFNAITHESSWTKPEGFRG